MGMFFSTLTERIWLLRMRRLELRAAEQLLWNIGRS